MATELNINNASIDNVDCDMYESTACVLNFLLPLVQNGTMIPFDGRLCCRADPDKGKQRAVREWLVQNPNIELIPYRHYANVGQSFIVNISEGNVS